MDKIDQCIETIKNELTWFLNNMNPNDYQGAEDDNELVNSLLTMNRSASNDEPLALYYRLIDNYRYKHPDISIFEDAVYDLNDELEAREDLVETTYAEIFPYKAFLPKE